MSRKKKLSLIFAGTAILLGMVFFAAINTGGIEVSLSQLLRGLFVTYDRDVAIVLQLRFPRIFVAMIGGMIMAASGVCMQAVMRNPLADPGIIGVTSGAAFAAVIIGVFFPALGPLMPLFSFAGGMAAFVIVYLLSWSREVSPIRLILTGIAVDACFTGLYEGVNGITGSTYTGAQSIINANISLKTWEDVQIIVLYGLVAMLLCGLAARKCNLLALSDKTLISLGVNVTKTRMLISVLAVMMASVFTSMVGAVSFLGLIVPHIARLLVGSDHKVLIWYSGLLGALMLLLADTVGRWIAYPYEISAAIIMAIIGGPALIILLRRSGMIYGK